MNFKNQYFKENKIDKYVLKNDLKLINRLIKKLNYITFPCRFQLFKNKKSGRLYLTTTTIDFKLVILKFSDKQSLNEQMIELFPEYNFFKDNSAGGFNLFPGIKNGIYGYSDETDIILGSSSVILEF